MLTLQGLLDLQDRAMEIMRECEPGFHESYRRLTAVVDFDKTNPGNSVGPFTGNLDGLVHGIQDRTSLFIWEPVNQKDVVLVPAGDGRAPISGSGYCKKTLGWYPGDTLPDHRHQTAVIVERDALEAVLQKLTDLKLVELQVVNPEFTKADAVEGYEDLDRFAYLVPVGIMDLTPEQLQLADEVAREYGGRIVIGKKETFIARYGGAFYFGPELEDQDCRAVSMDCPVWNSIPVAQRCAMFMQNGRGEREPSPDLRMIEMVPPYTYTLNSNTPHLVVAVDENGKPRPFIADEASRQSHDGLDIFGDKGIHRATKVLYPIPHGDEMRYEVILASRVPELLGIQPL